MTRIIVVDDHVLMRAGLVTLLRGLKDVEVCGEGATLADALQLARTHRPDLAILDFSLPDGDGVKAAAAIRAAGIKTVCLLVTMHSEPFVLAAARREPSIRGYILKADAFEDLAKAIQTTLRGGRFVSPTLAGELGLMADDPQLNDLSQREIEVLSLVASGESNLVIAGRLSITVKTVEAHRKRIRHKIGAGNTVDMVRYAFRAGLVQG
jgi:two-component system nitrate/nitrite response regulator NarL